MDAPPPASNFTFDKWRWGAHDRGTVRKGLEMTESKSSRDELIEKIMALKDTTRKEATDWLVSVLEGMTALLTEGKKISFVGWGSFEVQERKARQGRNPSTGKVLEIPASKRIPFKAGSKLKEAVNSTE
jgi:DNA-binding protein HU-beta